MDPTIFSNREYRYFSLNSTRETLLFSQGHLSLSEATFFDLLTLIDLQAPTQPPLLAYLQAYLEQGLPRCKIVALKLHSLSFICTRLYLQTTKAQTTLKVISITLKQSSCEKSILS